MANGILSCPNYESFSQAAVPKLVQCVSQLKNITKQLSQEFTIFSKGFMTEDVEIKKYTFTSLSYAGLNLSFLDSRLTTIITAQTVTCENAHKSCLNIQNRLLCFFPPTRSNLSVSSHHLYIVRAVCTQMAAKHSQSGSVRISNLTKQTN